MFRCTCPTLRQTFSTTVWMCLVAFIPRSFRVLARQRRLKTRSWCSLRHWPRWTRFSMSWAYCMPSWCLRNRGVRCMHAVDEDSLPVSINSTRLLTRMKPWWDNTMATLSWKSQKVRENFFPFFKALESPWKWIWCLKVLEFNIGGPWKCLRSKIVSNPRYVKNFVFRQMSTTERIRHWISYLVLMCSLTHFSCLPWMQ